MSELDPAEIDAMRRRLQARRLALVSILGFWAFYFAINTLRSALWESPDFLDMLGRRALVTVSGVGLTALLWLVLQARESAPTRQLIGAAFLAAVPLSLAYATINHLAFFVISPSDDTLANIARDPDKLKPAAMIIDASLNWYFFIVAWATLWIALSYAGKVRGAERAAARYRAEAQTAQLRALRYQVNPHFLFNTLNSLSSLVMTGRASEAERMILNLSTFFRTSLTTDPAADVPLADEIAMQRFYLEIEGVRFPERLIVDIDVPPELEDARVPSLILQPLVENAVKYGVARASRPVTVTVRAREQAGRLLLTVSDDGSPSPKVVAGTGTGLRNVCERLRARFGVDAECRYGPVYKGFLVELAMPLSRG